MKRHLTHVPVLSLPLMLVACAKTDAVNTADQTVEPKDESAGVKSMSKSSKLPGSQEDGQDVKVCHPQKIEQLEYDPKINRVLHIPSGDFLILSSGHAGGVGQYTFGNLDTGMVAYGGYYSSGGFNGPLVYRIPSLRTELGGDKPHLSRAEFDLTRIAEMFRASIDVSVPNHGKEVLVIDSRPATPTLSDATTNEGDAK